VAEDMAESLRAEGSFRSNQSRVWEEVEEVACRQTVHSPTGALADVYTARRGSLKEYVKAFAPQEGQSGLLVLIEGKVTGVEALSRSEALKKVYGKIIASYALDALGQSDIEGSDFDAGGAARQFMGALAASTVSRTSSVSLGNDLRLRGNGVIGAALEVAGTLVCLSAFPERTVGDQGCGIDMQRASKRRDSLL
jgi:hypothetical protein